MWKGMKKAYGVCILHLQCNSYETENITVQVFDNQMLTNIREFQIITSLGHQSSRATRISREDIETTMIAQRRGVS